MHLASSQYFHVINNKRMAVYVKDHLKTCTWSAVRVWTISYPESSCFLVSRRCQERLWGNGKKCDFLIGCSGLRTVNHRIPAVTIALSQSLFWRRPPTKNPEDSGYEIGSWKDILSSSFLTCPLAKLHHYLSTLKIINPWMHKGKQSPSLLPISQWLLHFKQIGQLEAIRARLFEMGLS